MNALLDYELRQDTEGDWTVWTPDNNGAVIGVGRTEQEAKADAVRNMESLIAELGGGK
jgi:hypothetical protein